MEGKLRVLVVDDDRRMVRTMCDIMNLKGYEAVAAHTGEEAVEKVRNGPPDCVFMDIKMPGMNGVETLQVLKQLSPDLPVVLMSAYATEEMQAEAKMKGAYAVLDKPFDIQAILSFLSLFRKEESILIVDDDPGFCRTMKDVLQTRDYRIVTETDPEKTLGHMENDYKLVVLLDIRLGEKNGLDVLRDIRAKYPTKPVVLVTGYGEDMSEAVKKGHEVGAYACLYKPLELESLIGLIEEIRLKKLKAVLGETF